MGFAKCRVSGCPETGSQEYVLSTAKLSTRGVYLWLPSMWRHYAVVHGFLPSDEARQLVMGIMPDDLSLTGQLTQTRSAVPDSALRKVEVLKVEKTSDGYDHDQGRIDWEFIQHLDRVLGRLHPTQSKSLQETGTYR